MKRLILCHFSAGIHREVEELRREARQTYPGPVDLPEEFLEYRV